MVKCLPIMQETQVQSLGQEDVLEKEMATDSSILAWKIPWTEEPGGLYSPWGRKELDTTEQLRFHHCVGHALLNKQWICEKVLNVKKSVMPWEDIRKIGDMTQPSESSQSDLRNETLKVNKDLRQVCLSSYQFSHLFVIYHSLGFYTTLLSKLN